MSRPSVSLEDVFLELTGTDAAAAVDEPNEFDELGDSDGDSDDDAAAAGQEEDSDDNDDGEGE